MVRSEESIINSFIYVTVQDLMESFICAFTGKAYIIKSVLDVKEES